MVATGANQASTLESISEALPFLGAKAELLSNDVTYTGLGQSFFGRDEYVAAAGQWRDVLPSRLRNLECYDKILLPPDARGVVSCRYRLSFDAPVPPAVLPGQRRRLDAAQLERTADGRTRVAAIVSATLELDETGRVRSHSETLVADPFAVTTSIAHFELLNARAVALLDVPAMAREPFAYWEAMRGMMRIELEESSRLTRSDEAAVLDGGRSAGVSDEEFEAKFRLYIAQIFAIGFCLPAGAFLAAKLLRAAMESIV